MGLNASIIVPAYNSEKTIRQCVESLKKQKFRGKFEIIVADDGSKDRTAEIAEKAGAKVLKQKNAGPAKARNNGAKNAKYEILVFTDSDCIAEPNWLEEMLVPFADRDVAGVQGAYKSRQESLVAKFVQAEIEERYDYMDRHADGLDWVGSYSAAYRVKDFFDASGFDESFPKASGEDPELSYKISKTGRKLVFTRKAIVYHTHPETIPKYFWTKFYRAFYRINLYSKHPDKIAQDSYTPNSVKSQIISAYLGLVVFLMIPVFYALGYVLIAQALLAVNIIIAVIATIYTVISMWRSKEDFAVALFTFVMIQVRTAAFMFGLPIGLIKHKILR